VSQRRPVMFVLTLAVALLVGGWARRAALDSGLWADDYAQRAMLEDRYPSQRAIWDLFHFVDGTSEDHQRIVDYGVDPWWTHPSFRLSLLRPLPSLTIAADHALFPQDARAQHLHSFVWWGLFLLVVGSVFFYVMPPLTAAIALLLVCVDETQTVPVLWLANRSALMATTFTLASLATHLRWKKMPNRTSLRIASIALFGLALSCGEYAFASLGYMLFVEWAEPATPHSRIRAVLPFVLLALAFIGISSVLGYGSAHSALYTSPFSAPLDYAYKTLVGFPVLMADLVLGVPADWWSFGSPWPEQLRTALAISPAAWEHLPSWRACQLSFGVLSILIVLGALRWVRDRIAREHFLALVWLVGGATLGLLPVLGSFITTRLALPSSVGFAALFASVIGVAVSQSALPKGARSARKVAALIFAAVAVFIHGYRAFTQTEATTSFFAFLAQSRTRWPLTAELEPSKQAGQRLVMIASADANDAAYIPFVRASFRQPLLRGFRLLSGAPGAHAITRIDERTLDVRVVDDFGLGTSVAGSLTRAVDEGMAAGDKAHVAGMDVTVVETHQGQPTHMRIQFDVPLESEELAFVHSTSRGLEHLALPQVGGTLQLPAPTMPNLFLLSGP
jgi:hypothetical protein